MKYAERAVGMQPGLYEPRSFRYDEDNIWNIYRILKWSFYEQHNQNY